MHVTPGRSNRPSRWGGRRCARSRERNWVLGKASQSIPPGVRGHKRPGATFAPEKATSGIKSRRLQVFDRRPGRGEVTSPGSQSGPRASCPRPREVRIGSRHGLKTTLAYDDQRSDSLSSESRTWTTTEHDQLQRRHAELEILYDTVRDLSSTLSVQQVLDAPVGANPAPPRRGDRIHPAHRHGFAAAGRDRAGASRRGLRFDDDGGGPGDLGIRGRDGALCSSSRTSRSTRASRAAITSATTRTRSSAARCCAWGPCSASST